MEGEERERVVVEVHGVLASRVPQLARLASVLTCSVCYESLDRPVTTPCGHSFCSLCIRRFLQFQQRCPRCLQATHEPELRPDRTAELLIQEWPSLLASLAALVPGSGKENTAPSTATSTAPSTDSSQLFLSQPFSKPPNTQPLKPQPLASQPFAPQPLAPQSTRAPPPSKPPQPAPAEASLLECSQLSSCSQAAACTVCGVTVSLQHLPRHQQHCAARLAAPAPPPTPPPRPQLPKLVYALVKEPELRRKLKELSLNTKGDKQALVKRHKRFCLLYNVEREAGRRRADSWLAARVAREEQEELAGRTATPALLDYDKKTDAKVMEQKKKTYIKQNSSTFAQLVSHAREAKAKVDGALMKETVTDNDDEVFTDTQEAAREAAVGTKRPLVTSPAASEGRKRRRSQDALRTPVKAAGGVSQLYVTPTKAHVTELAKSPRLRNTNIIDQLNRSAEQSRRVERAACPVCGLEVQQRFLNIHLDKCLRSAEPVASPVVGRTRRRGRAASSTSSNMFAVDPAEEAGDAPLPTDFLELVEEREERRSFGTNELFEVMEVKGVRRERDREQVEKARCGDEEVRPGDEGVRAGDKGVRAGDEGVRPGDEGVRPGDEGVRPGDEGVRPGDEGVRPGEGCSSPSYSPPESPSLLEEVEPSQNLWGRGEKEKVAVERVEEEEEDMFADSEEINKETSVKQVEEVKVVKRVRVVKSVVGNKTSDRSAKTRDLSEVQPLVKKRFHKRVNASHRASLEYDPRAMDMTSSQEVVVREVARSQGKMARSQGEVARSQGKVTRSQGEVVREVEGAVRSTRSRRNASVLLGGAST